VSILSILSTNFFRNTLLDLLSRRDSGTNLFASDASPADDDHGEYRFHLSSNVLLWHTQCKLGKLLSLPQFREFAPSAVSGGSLNSVAAVLRTSILKNFTGRNAFTILAREIVGILLESCGLGQGMYRHILAYGIDPSKDLKDPLRYRHYHDGTDMPTLFVREWGFLKAQSGKKGDDPALRDLWENTMAWSFTPSEALAGFNTGYQGTDTEPFHRLGSDRSPEPWPLGFFQEWKFAQMVEDKGREHKTWIRIRKLAHFGGTFSEAVDIQTGVCTSTAWPSWPGAMIAENLIDTVIGQVQGC
jgi:uncharacterized protein